MSGRLLSGRLLSGRLLRGRLLSGRLLSGKLLRGRLLSGRLLSGRLLSGTCLRFVLERRRQERLCRRRELYQLRTARESPEARLVRHGTHLNILSPCLLV